MIARTVPKASGGVSKAVTVRRSPSGSESLAGTSSTVVEPARTPRSSSWATGGRFSCSRSSGSCSWTSCWDSSSSSLASCGGMTSSQFSTISIASLTSHTVPETRSLRTTTSRLTRKTSRASVSDLSIGCSTVSPLPQRAWCTPVPEAQAPWLQPATTTGSLGVPGWETGSRVGSPRPSGTRSIPSRAATTTSRAAADGAWSSTWAVSASPVRATGSVPGRSRVTRAAVALGGARPVRPGPEVGDVRLLLPLGVEAGRDGDEGGVGGRDTVGGAVDADGDGGLGAEACGGGQLVVGEPAHAAGGGGVDLAAARVEDGDGVPAELDPARPGQRDRRRRRHRGGVDLLEQAGALVDQEDVTGVLQDIEARAACGEAAVEQLHLAVEPAQPHVLLAGDPHPAVVEVDVGRRDAVVEHTGDDEPGTQHADGGGADDTLPAPCGGPPRPRRIHPAARGCASRCCLVSPPASDSHSSVPASLVSGLGAGTARHRLAA